MRHIKSIHKGVKFPCDQCDYKATRTGPLLEHIKSIHEGVKFPCDQCDYKATLKESFSNQFIKVLIFLVIRHQRKVLLSNI